MVTIDLCSSDDGSSSSHMVTCSCCFAEVLKVSPCCDTNKGECLNNGQVCEDCITNCSKCRVTICKDHANDCDLCSKEYCSECFSLDVCNECAQQPQHFATQHPLHHPHRYHNSVNRYSQQPQQDQYHRHHQSIQPLHHRSHHQYTFDQPLHHQSQPQQNHNSTNRYPQQPVSNKKKRSRGLIQDNTEEEIPKRSRKSPPQQVLPRHNHANLHQQPPNKKKRSRSSREHTQDSTNIPRHMLKSPPEQSSSLPHNNSSSRYRQQQQQQPNNNKRRKIIELLDVNSPPQSKRRKHNSRVNPSTGSTSNSVNATPSSSCSGSMNRDKIHTPDGHSFSYRRHNPSQSCNVFDCSTYKTTGCRASAKRYYGENPVRIEYEGTHNTDCQGRCLKKKRLQQQKLEKEKEQARKKEEKEKERARKKAEEEKRRAQKETRPPPGPPTPGRLYLNPLYVWRGGDVTKDEAKREGAIYDGDHVKFFIPNHLRHKFQGYFWCSRTCQLEKVILDEEDL